MQFIHIVLRSVLIISLFSNIVYGTSSSKNPDPMEQTIEAIEDCIANSPDKWPDEWKKEYIETIRKAVELHHDASHYAERLEILGKGFAPYWESLMKTKDRFLFDVHLAQIRWYTEHLMSTEFPSKEEKQKLRDQYTNIWDYATDSLLKQFPFLDPNAIGQAKAEYLRKCYRKIDAPLMPVYLKPMSEEHVAQIKQRWDKLRYIRVDLWRQLNHGSSMPVERSDTSSADAELDYELTKKSMSQLHGQVWMVVSQRPDYYLNVLENRNKVLRRLLRSKRQARSNQQLLESMI